MREKVYINRRPRSPDKKLGRSQPGQARNALWYWFSLQQDVKKMFFQSVSDWLRLLVYIWVRLFSPRCLCFWS